MIKLTNEIIDERLKNRIIKRIDDYEGLSVKIKWECLKCSYVFCSKPREILDGSGCHRCSKRIRLNNEIVDEKLSNRLIKRLDNVNNNRCVFRWLCLTTNCNYIWKTCADSILNNNRGCPKCSRKIALTNESVDARLNNRPIKRLDDINGTGRRVNWECLDCHHIWITSPDSILNGKRGCPNCKYKNEKIVYGLLKQYNIDFEHQKDIRSININETRFCKVDFYIPSVNLIIEYNGKQHYEPVRFHGIPSNKAKINFMKQKERDDYINKFCNDNNIKLLKIDGREYQNDLLREFIKKFISDTLV